MKSILFSCLASAIVFNVLFPNTLATIRAIVNVFGPLTK